MKALIRNQGETVLESYGIPCIDWNTGAPLTNPAWAGGPYVLVENYDPTVCEVIDPVEFVERAGVENPAPETVTIDGKEYTKDELLAILNQTA
jgi:hypothetical protein